MCMSNSHARDVFLEEKPWHPRRPHTTARRKTCTSPGFVPRPLSLPSVAVWEVHNIPCDTAVRVLVCQRTPRPPPHHFKTDQRSFDLLSPPASVHLEPVCASPGCFCPTPNRPKAPEGKGWWWWCWWRCWILKAEAKLLQCRKYQPQLRWFYNTSDLWPHQHRFNLE